MPDNFHAFDPISPQPSPPAQPPLRWELFCQVIDNFGDIGLCWRLAAQLAARGHSVRLWTDDASALAWMAPGGAPGVQVLPWPQAAPADGPGDVVLEAFGCAIPEPFIAAMAQPGRARPPLWLNLEYLSAESYVERCHGLPSPVSSGPGAGLVRWFFYPGFTPQTGGLLRETDLPARQAGFDRPAWRSRQGIAQDALAVALFCYEPPALGPLLQQLRALPAARLLVTPGRASAAVQTALPSFFLDQNSRFPASDHGEQLSISYLQACPQTAFDELLWGCDLNFVRGEDSLVRALWAGQPLIWQIYPQHDNAHHAKLHAFLDWLQAPPSLRQAHLAWNGLGPQDFPALTAATLAQWRACVRQARHRLVSQTDLLTQLLGFSQQKS
ncbi:elongation factor P maturation arginine rhamnosyltransferase EarP [Melaminivora sp.]